MASDDQTLSVFQTRVRQMLLRYQQLKKENEELYAMVDQAERETRGLRAELERKEQEYETLKMMKMLEVSDNDLDATKNRLARLIRDVNKCITLLSEQK